MAARRSWGGTSRIRLTVMFLVVLLPPAVTLIWLGFRLLEQDRALEARREIETREAAVDAVTRSLEKSLNSVEHGGLSDSLPDGALRVTFNSSGMKSSPAGQLLWTGIRPPLPQAPEQLFESAEALEFQGAPQAALAVYQELARSAEPGVRAGALLRKARVERNQRRVDEALRTYKNLSAIASIGHEGTPVDLLARRNVCTLLEESSRPQELAVHVKDLEADFLTGRWVLDRPDWELVSGEIERWSNRPLPVSEDRRAFSVAADWMWNRLQDGNLPSSGRRSLLLEGTPLTLVWHSRESQIEAILIGPTLLRSWTGAAATANSGAARLALSTESGELLTGEAADSAAHIVLRTPAVSGLPWTVSLSPDSATRETADFAGRRRLLGFGLAAIIIFLGGGGVFLWRVMAHELAVARLQADFVAAVSHEFRTPLTSLHHVTELLEEDDGLPPGPERDKRKAFYAALARNTDRLQRLVESLLDFSRMETGRKPWKLEPMDAGVLAADVAREFRKEAEPLGVRIDLSLDPADTLNMQADRTALGHALWNLLDNAVKYSPEARPVHISVARHPRGIAISVSDEGLGVPAGERRDIFRKFVRGRKAGELGIKGTGLGLAMVSYIVEAHGGTIELESEEGKGSTFRLVLPALA